MRQLRPTSQSHPAGLEPKTAQEQEANVLASRSAQLALSLQWKTGGTLLHGAPRKLIHLAAKEADGLVDERGTSGADLETEMSGPT